MSKKRECLLMCDICGMNFRDTFGLKRHLRAHENNYDIKKFRMCHICGLQLRFKMNFDKHLLESHDISVEKKLLTFSNVLEFNTWKDTLEQETQSRYIKRRSPVKRQDGTCITYYYCHRDGYYVPVGKNVRSLKSIGTNKINGACPARMKVEENSEGVRLLFTSTHVGHRCEITRMVLPKSEKDKIAKKIAMKVPLSDILDGIGNAAADMNLQKIHLLTKQDLRNISASYGIENNEHEMKGFEAVNKWVMHMSETSDIVRLFKPWGIVSPGIPKLKFDDFCLILSNSVQREYLKNLGNDIICVDKVFGQSDNDFQLFTILVFDDARNAFPCAFMFCNRTDSLIVDLFYRTTISSLDCEISPKFFVSDVNGDFFHVWSVMYPSNEIQELYSAWHVDKGWQQNLNKIKSNEKKAEVYKKIKLLLIECYKNNFDVSSKKLIQELSSSDLTMNFAKYFEKLILDPSKWAYSYRMQTTIDIDHSIEVIHRNLEYVCYVGKKAKNILKSIHALLKFLKDHIFQKSIQECSINNPKKSSVLRKRHLSSLKISTDSVHQINEKEWIVFCSFEAFSVSSAKTNCSCELKCAYCNTCVHSFSCSCCDYAVFWNMCKHIHLVSRVVSNIAYETPKTLCDTDPSSDIDHAMEIYVDSLFDVEYMGTDAGNSKSENCIEININSLNTESHTDPEQTRIKELPIVNDLEWKKSCELNKILRIFNEIKTETGLEALKKFIDPLEDAVRSAESSATCVKDFPQQVSLTEHSYSKYVPWQEVMEIVEEVDVVAETSEQRIGGSCILLSQNVVD